MTEAVLRVRTAGGADALALIQSLERAAAGSQQRTERVVRTSRQRVVRETQQAAQTEANVYRGAGAQIERSEQLLTRSKLRELARRGEAQKKFSAMYVDAERQATTLIEAEVGKRGALSERERRQVQTLALAIVSEREKAERHATAIAARAEQQRIANARRFMAGAPSAIGNAAVAGIQAFAGYGDDVRAQQHARDQVDLRAAQIASGDIGDAGATQELSRATEQVSRLAGIDPQGVIEAIGQAQANFSNLATAADRGSYLNDVLPMLARAAVASNTSLTDMVQAAGEFQRQLGVTNAQLPAAIAQAIQGGRLGSISFADQARHMGAVGGAAGRFLSTRPEDALQSLATTNTLFQFAGRAGGGGDVSASRARAFIDNFTSTRGQTALQSTLGHNVMGADGQIATRQGESQSAAFQRVVEETYARTHGNSTEFLNAIAGQNTRSRTLGDQLYRDLRGHGGHMSDFSSILSRQLQGTAESTITQPFENISRTTASRRAREDVTDFYHRTGATSDSFRDTEEQTRQLRRDNPFLGAMLADNGIFRGMLDVTNRQMQSGQLQASGALPPSASRAQQQEALAHDLAVTRTSAEISPIQRAMMSRETLSGIVRQTAAEELARLQLRDQAVARGQNPLNISDESIRRLADAIAARPTMSTNDAIHGQTAAGAFRSRE